MADSLFLRGFNEVTKHTGNEMQIVPGKGGSSKFIKWWSSKSCGIKCTMFNVTLGNGNAVTLAVDSNSDSHIMITHDGKGGFTFSRFHNISRAAVFPVGSYNANDIIAEYLFPSLSRGAVLTRKLGELPEPKKEETVKKEEPKKEEPKKEETVKKVSVKVSSSETKKDES